MFGGNGTGLCGICLEMMRVPRSCCIVQGTGWEWPDNLGLRRKLGRRWPSFFLRKGCPHWWPVSYAQPNRITQKRRKCLQMLRLDGSNSYQGASTHSPIPWMAEPVMVCFSCGRLGHRVSRCSWTDTGQCGPEDRRDVSSGETRAGGQTPGSAIHVALLTLPRCPGWSPSWQSYPPLSLHQAMHPSEWIGKAGRRLRLTAQPPMERIDPAIKDVQIVSGRDLTPPFTPVSGVRWDIRKMWPAGQNKRSPRRPGRSNGVNDVMTDGIIGTGTVQITFIFIDFCVCVSRFKHVLFSDRFQFAF